MMKKMKSKIKKNTKYILLGAVILSIMLIYIANPLAVTSQTTKQQFINEVYAKGNAQPILYNHLSTTRTDTNEWVWIYNSALGYREGTGEKRTILVRHLTDTNPVRSTTHVTFMANGNNVESLEKTWVTACINELSFKYMPTPTPTPPCTVNTNKNTYRIGETITITYTNVPSRSTLSCRGDPHVSGASAWTVSGTGTKAYKLKSGDTIGNWKIDIWGDTGTLLKRNYIQVFCAPTPPPTPYIPPTPPPTPYPTSPPYVPPTAPPYVPPTQPPYVPPPTQPPYVPPVYPTQPPQTPGFGLLASIIGVLSAYMIFHKRKTGGDK